MGKNVFASRQEPVQNSSEETPSEADGVGCQAEGEWVMHEPKIPPSAYFLYVAGERERMRKTLGKPKALELQVFEIQSGWSKMDPERKAEFEARASQLQELYRVQKREYKQHGQFRSVPSSSSGNVNWKMPDAEPVQKSDENDPDWKFLEVQLESCLASLRSHFANMEPVHENRKEVLDDMLEAGMTAMLSSIKSDRSKVALDRYLPRLRFNFQQKLDAMLP